MTYILLLEMVLSSEGFKGNIRAVAADLDYYDQSHFIKDFKTIVGQTPSCFIREQADFPLDQVEEYLGQWD